MSLPPLEKLPLAVRKSIRDKWEAGKEEQEQALSKLLGTDWKFEFNGNAIYAYAIDGYAKDNFGDCLLEYAKGVNYQVKRFVEKNGDEGKAEVNNLASKHIVTMAMSDKCTYNGCDVHDGELRVLFNPKCLGSNIGDALEKLGDELSKAQTAGLNVNAKTGIKKYEEGIGKVHEKLVKMLGMEKLVLNPRFEENFQILKGSKNNSRADDFDKILGRATLDYFDSLAKQLERQGFKPEDDMLQEGFQEACTKSEIQFQVVEKLKKRTYNNSYFEDGMLILEVPTNAFWSNDGDMGQGIVDLL